MCPISFGRWSFTETSLHPLVHSLNSDNAQGRSAALPPGLVSRTQAEQRLKPRLPWDAGDVPVPSPYTALMVTTATHDSAVIHSGVDWSQCSGACNAGTPHGHW